MDAGEKRTPYELLGGDAKVRELVDRFYDLMEFEPAYKQLRAVHGNTLESAREKLYQFLCGWLGGPPLYTDRYGHPMLRARHLPFALNVPGDERDGALEFAKGLWDPDEPELWQKDLTGRIVHWIEVGQPEERRLVKASGRADRVSVYAFSHGAPAWWAGLSARVGRAGNVDAWLVVGGCRRLGIFNVTRIIGRGNCGAARAAQLGQLLGLFQLLQAL